jgi:hypothetical protein
MPVIPFLWESIRRSLTKPKKAGGVSQVVQHLPSKHKILSSNPREKNLPHNCLHLVFPSLTNHV